MRASESSTATFYRAIAQPNDTGKARRPEVRPKLMASRDETPDQPMRAFGSHLFSILVKSTTSSPYRPQRYAKPRGRCKPSNIL